MRSKKKSLGQTDSYAKEVGLAILPKVAVWGVGIGAVYFLVLRPILQKVGVIKTSEEKKTEVAVQTNQTSLLSPFSPRYWREIKNAVILKQASSTAMAKIIYDAIGSIYDNETEVYGVFRQLKSKTQVSYLADVFYQKYKVDMYNYLSRNLNATEIGIVNGIVSGLL